MAFRLFLISLFGWSILARHFRTDSKPPGLNFPMQGGNIGLGQYNGCLSLVVAENGLWLRPWLPFRFCHPPLLLPWSAFEAPKIEKVFWAKQWTAQVKTPDKKRVKVIFSVSVGELIAARLETAQTQPNASPWA